jgi:anti-sigma factor ChrR (cupin superfamily)
LRKKVLATATLPKGVEALVRAGEMRWRPTPFTGVTYKPLFVDPIGGQAASLVRLEAGAVYPAHRHTEVEHSFILEGDAVFDDHTLFAGDYEAAGAGRRHSSITSKTGCVVFLLHNRHDEVFVH